MPSHPDTPELPDKPARPEFVDFHFDPLCPFAYQTSVWIRDVRAETGLEIHWRFFSLEEINLVPGKKHPWEREWSYGWSLMRIGALLRRRDESLVDAWYERAGYALHVEGLKPHVPEVAKELLEQIGIDPAAVDEALADPTTGDEVLADHRRVTAGGGFGVPTLAFPDGDFLFGPVLVDPPTGAAAVELWDAVLAWRNFPYLFEMQRPKGPTHLKHLGEVLSPYIEGRDWESVNRGKIVNLRGLLNQDVENSG